MRWTEHFGGKGIKKIDDAHMYNCYAPERDRKGGRGEGGREAERILDYSCNCSTLEEDFIFGLAYNRQ